MTGSGRRRSSKWDLKEKTLPENPRDCARSSKDASLYEDESRDHMSGSEGMREESIPGFQRDGHYETRKSTGFDGGKQQTRTHSSKSGDRSFRSRSRNKSKSRSRSRSPTRNPRRQPSSNDQSSRSGHTVPLCRDFSAGKCIKGDRCNFSHHGSLGRDLDKRVGNDWERDDKAMRSYSNTSSTERKSTNICNDFLKGRCRRDASCKFPHHDLGSDELRKRTVDGCSYEKNEVVYSEMQPKHNLNGMHEASTDICYATKLILADAPGDYIQNFSDFLDGTRTTGMENDVSSYRDLGGIHHQLDKKFGVLPISCATGVQESQPAFCLNPINGGIEMPYHQETFQSPQPVDSQHNDGTLLHNADVLGGQLSQFPDLSTALSDLLENKNESTQLYAVIDGESQISNSLAYVPPVTSPFNQGTTFRLPYDAMSGDELGYQSVDPNHQELVSKEQENEGGTGKETTEAEEHGPREDVTANGDDHNNEKKVKDVKVMRLFKFSLAEFVKELLKPAWKEGKMSKEVYKTIVKKVVDKVADSIQEAHIPGTKEKIDQYLSFSKPKLTKLVQAYLERYKKI